MSNEEIKRLGKRIENSDEISDEDLELLQQYRESFQKPIADVYDILFRISKAVDKDSIITYRIKRIDSIIRKLKRFKDNPKGSIALSRMADIAGCRCILSTDSIEPIYHIVDQLKNEYGDKCTVFDHIAPAKQSGYRSVHLHIKDKSTNKPIEIQIRNIGHHNWATLVEIIDLLFDTNVKESEDETSEFGRFMKLYANKDELNKDELRELTNCESKHQIFETMSNTITGNYLNVKQQWLLQSTKGTFFVIEASEDRKTYIDSFNTFETAEEEYYRRYSLKPLSNIVLTHILRPTFDKISLAYSNYMLSMHAFIAEYRHLIENNIIDSIQENDFFEMVRYYKIYRRNTKSHYNNLIREASKVNDCITQTNVRAVDAKKWKKELISKYSLWRKETTSFLYNVGKVCRGRKLYHMYFSFQLKKLGKDLSKMSNLS